MSTLWQAGKHILHNVYLMLMSAVVTHSSQLAPSSKAKAPFSPPPISLTLLLQCTSLHLVASELSCAPQPRHWPCVFIPKCPNFWEASFSFMALKTHMCRRSTLGDCKLLKSFSSDSRRVLKYVRLRPLDLQNALMHRIVGKAGMCISQL